MHICLFASKLEGTKIEVSLLKTQNKNQSIFHDFLGLPNQNETFPSMACVLFSKILAPNWRNPCQNNCVWPWGVVPLNSLHPENQYGSPKNQPMENPLKIYRLVVSTQCKNMLVKIDHFPKQG